MAKILCSYSSLYYQCEHFPIHLTQGESHHPIFDAPLKKLWKIFPKWQAGELDAVSSYLYYLSLLKSTELVEFRVAAAYTENTDRIVASNMESLFSVISQILSVRNPRVVFPRFVISPDTKSLSNSKHWIELWKSVYEDFINGLKSEDTRTNLQRREAALERLIKNPALKPERYAHLLAQWAAIAGNFPESLTTVNGNSIPLSEYWQDIICKCYKQTDIIQIPESDLVELLEHCETEIDLGSIFSYQLFNTLREGLETIQGFFGIGSPTFSILGNDSDVGDSNLQLLIASAPISEPKRIDYPTEFAFIKARMKWALASSQSNSNNSNNTGEIK